MCLNHCSWYSVVTKPPMTSLSLLQNRRRSKCLFCCRMQLVSRGVHMCTPLPPVMNGLNQMTPKFWASLGMNCCHMVLHDAGLNISHYFITWTTLSVMQWSTILDKKISSLRPHIHNRHKIILYVGLSRPGPLTFNLHPRIRIRIVLIPCPPLTSEMRGSLYGFNLSLF